MKVLVFGSNCKGIHGAGSARVAAMAWGAKFGVGEGLTGRAYAIPTKETPYKRRLLSDVKCSAFWESLVVVLTCNFLWCALAARWPVSRINKWRLCLAVRQKIAVSIRCGRNLVSSRG